MSAQDRAIQKLARELAGIKKEVVSWRGPQADYTSIENGGNFTFKDGDGNVTGIIGGQDDGSTTVRHVDGPTPPIPSGLSAHVDGPIIQVSWDGSFEDADSATFDWSHLEVVAVGPNSENLRGTISDATGASTNLAATSSGVWTVVARSVSRAEKRSLDGDAGTVDVKLVDIDGAIEAVQDSANGKNKVTYSEFAPTPADPGIFDDTWFVGQVGRPNDLVEATNLAVNPSFTTFLDQDGEGDISDLADATLSISSAWSSSGATSLKIDGSTRTADYSGAFLNRSTPRATPDFTGKTYTVGIDFHIDAPQTGALYSRPRSFLIGWYNSAGAANYMTGAGQWPQAPNTAGTHRLTQVVNLPSGEGVYGWFVRVHDGSAGVSYWDSMTIEEGVTSGVPFDGDTPSGTTDNESHYRWTGTPHASTSEKYLPALSIGESDAWNITEQYRHDGTSWVRVELSHKVFSSVDLGKATVGELDGIRITGKSVRGEQLSGDAIDGKVITGGTYRTTGGTGSWSDDGLFIAQPDGTSLVRFPTDGSPLSLTASDVQIDRASIADLDLSYGSVRSGGTVELASGVTAPASPPELTTGWQKVATLEEPNEGYYGAHSWEGLAYWAEGDGHWVRAVNAFTTERDPYDGFETYDYATGELQARRQIDINPSQGITVMGDTVYALGQGHGSGSNRERYYIDGYDLNTGERVSRYEYTRNISARNALGNDGTNLIIGSVHNRELWVHRRNPVTGVQVGSDMRSGSNSWNVGYTNDLEAVSISGSVVHIVHREGARGYSISGGVLTLLQGENSVGWTNPNKNAAGMVWRDGLPYVVDGAGYVYQGTNTVSDYTIELCFTWWDGTHETTPSGIASVVVASRLSVTVSLPKRAGLQKRLYMRQGTSGDWVRETAGQDATAHTVTRVSPLVPRHPLPTTNTFPNADPATLKSTNDKFVVNGDGSGHWGPLTFNSDGTMSSSAVPEWVPVTTFASGFGPQTFGFAPAYRIWPDGKVEWRGVITGTMDDTKPMLTVPVGARPAQAVNLTVVTNTAVNTCRVEFSSNDLPTGLVVYPVGTTRTWLSLDGIFYYLD